MKPSGKTTGFILTAIVCLFFNVVFAGEPEVFFSPKGGCTDAVVRELKSAKRYIHVAMYAFTSRPIAQALIKAAKRGVKVKVVIDRRFCLSSKYCKANYLKKRGIKVKLVSPPPGPRGRRGLMHHKFAVIDGTTLITGSFNWTASAERLNYENMLVFHSKRMAGIYEREFERLWK